MKVVIIGGVAGGATTATRLRRLDENAEIIIIERGEYVSFANCGLPYYVGGVIEEKEDLLLQTPKSFKDRFNIDVRIKQEAIKIDRENKKIKIKNIEKNEIYEETYDKLVLSPGAEPINPFSKLDDERIVTLRTVNDSIKIRELINRIHPKNVSIIGGGYIGVEMAENIKEYSDINVSIIEKASHLIAPLDEDISSFIHNLLKKKNISLYLNNGVKNINKNKENFNIILENGEIESDLIIVSIGVKPETNLAKEADLKTNEKGSIIVNEKLQTLDEDIYALGDAIQVNNYVTRQPAYIPLAGPANKQARIVANNIVGKSEIYSGTLGSSILKVFEYNLAITGINENTCKMLGIEYKKIIITPYSHATYYPNAMPITIKAIYDSINGRILGAQIWGKESVDKIGDILATAIRMDMDANDLANLELCYAPPFSSAKSPVNILGNAIQNEMDGLVENVTFEQVEKIKSPYILDVRTVEEYEYNHINNAKNIPLDSLRSRINEIDKEQEIYVHCKTGLRSYIACRILKQKGFKVKNIIGGFDLYKTLKKDKKIEF